MGSMQFRCYRLGLIFFNIIYMVSGTFACRYKLKKFQLELLTYMTTLSSQPQNFSDFFYLMIYAIWICYIKDQMHAWNWDEFSSWATKSKDVHKLRSYCFDHLTFYFKTWYLCVSFEPAFVVEKYKTSEQKLEINFLAYCTVVMPNASALSRCCPAHRHPTPPPPARLRRFLEDCLKISEQFLRNQNQAFH